MQPIAVFIIKENPFITHNDLKQIMQSPRGTRCHMIPQPKSFINLIDICKCNLVANNLKTCLNSSSDKSISNKEMEIMSY